MLQTKERKNNGSAVIEATLLIPIFLGIVFFYIFFVLFEIETGNCVESMVEYKYNIKTKSDIKNAASGISIIDQGNTRIIQMEKTGQFFNVQLELKGNNGNPAEKIRRWQLAVSTISQGGV